MTPKPAVHTMMNITMKTIIAVNMAAANMNAADTATEQFCNRLIINGGNTMKYVCDVCGWIYDEAEGYADGGIAPGTKFEDLPEDFECPLCSVGKDQFSAE